MNRIKSALIGLLVMASISPAIGQVANYPQTLPANTVVGRTGVSSGPSQAIPFTFFSQSILGILCQTANAMPVYSGGRWSCTPSQTANTVLAGPSTGAAAQGVYRALVGADLPLPAASTLGGVMSKAAVASNWLRSIGTDGIPTASQPAFSDISGSVAATQLPNPSASTLGGIRSYAAVSNQWINQISTSGIPSSTQPACANISDAAVYCNAARGQLPGETTTGSATAGNVGEYVESVIAAGSPVSIVSATAKTIASITLTAGDWDVDCLLGTSTAASTSVTQIGVSISATTNTMDFTAGRTAQWFFPATVVGAATNAWMVPLPPLRFSLSGSTTLNMVALSVFTVSTLNGYGVIRARRVR